MDTRESVNCPVCGNTLKKIKAGNVTVDACDNGCGGIWFDSSELAKLNENDEKAGEKLLNISRNPNVTVNKQSVKNCPVCGTAMASYPLSLGGGFIIDECLDCGGMWLDNSEFNSLRKNSGIANSKVFDPTEAQSELRENEKPLSVKIVNFLFGY